MRNSYLFTSILFVLSFALNACSKSASDIKLLGLKGDGSQIIVDTKSIRGSGNRSIIRYSIIFSQQVIAKHERLPSFPNIKLNPVVAQDFVVAFDCSQSTYEYLDYNWHYRDGQIQNMGKQGKKIVFPNSPIEMAMEYACMPGWRRWFTEKFPGLN